MTFLQKVGLELGDNVVTPVVTLYARTGDVAKTESILSRFVTGMDKLHSNRRRQRSLTVTAVRHS